MPSATRRTGRRPRTSPAWRSTWRTRPHRRRTDARPWPRPPSTALGQLVRRRSVGDERFTGLTTRVRTRADADAARREWSSSTSSLPSATNAAVRGHLRPPPAPPDENDRRRAGIARLVQRMGGVNLQAIEEVRRRRGDKALTAQRDTRRRRSGPAGGDRQMNRESRLRCATFDAVNEQFQRLFRGCSAAAARTCSSRVGGPIGGRVNWSRKPPGLQTIELSGGSSPPCRRLRPLPRQAIPSACSTRSRAAGRQRRPLLRRSTTRPGGRSSSSSPTSGGTMERSSKSVRRHHGSPGLESSPSA